MQRALIRAKNLINFTRNGTEFATSANTQSNVWATAVTLDNKAKVHLVALKPPI